MPQHGLRTYVFTDHALDAIRRRGLVVGRVEHVLQHPEQRWSIRPGRDVFQSRVRGDSGLYLLRVFADVERKPARIVTAYRTSRIDRYWR